SYTLIAEGERADGFYVPSGGQTYSWPRLNVVIPKGYFGHWPYLGTGTQGGPTVYESCPYYKAVYEATAAGAPGGLNGGPFQISKWYATWSVDDGVPIADFGWKQTQGLDVQFDASFRKYSFEAEDGEKVPVQEYAWSFGDGQESTSAAPSITFDEPGIYPVTLTVTDNDGETDDVTRSVKVNGVILEYEEEVVQNSVEAGDTFTVIGKVKNIGSVAAENVTVRPLFGFITEYPESNWLETTDATRGAPAQSPEAQTFNNLGPGGQVTVTQIYTVLTGAERECDLSEECITEPVTVQWEATLGTISGFDAGGNSATIRDKCQDGVECSNKMLVVPATASINITAWVDSQESQTAYSGHRRRPLEDLGKAYPVTNFISEHVEEYQDGYPCFSGCADLKIEISGPGGNPVENGVLTIFRQPIQGVAPELGEGFLCKIPWDLPVLGGTNDCSEIFEIELESNETLVELKLWFPGVVENTTAKVVAVVTADGLAPAEAEFEIQIEPTVMPEYERVVTPRDHVLNAIGLGYELAKSPNLKKQKEFCRDLQRVTGFGYQSRVEQVFWDYIRRDFANVCQGFVYEIQPGGLSTEFELDERKISTEERVQTVTDVLSFYWFGQEFNVPIGQFIDIEYPTGFSGGVTGNILALTRALGAHYRATGERPTVSLDLYEVSGMFEADTFQDALYMDLTVANGPDVEIKKLLLQTYDNQDWADETSYGFTTQVSGGVSPDFAFIIKQWKIDGLLPGTGPGKTIVESSDDGPAQPGLVLLFDVGLATEERLQIAAVDDSLVTLTTPFRFDHADDARFDVIDSLTVGPPEPPLSASGLTGIPGTSTEPTLSWFSRSPASSFDVEVATDSLFSEIVATYSEVVADSVSVSGLDDRTTYFWRVAASTLTDQGEWSPPYSFTTGAAIGDSLSEAFALPSDLEVHHLAFLVGATNDEGEGLSSCSSGGKGIWFSYEAALTGVVAFETFESDFNTVLSVWSGTDHPLTEITCNDDWEDSRGDV
ncbi:MAG: PKD domain-containing protein, partial [Rhodothermales bacterium]|nr:PKD domain-containing protein [Rhodothermales bacterium]